MSEYTYYEFQTIHKSLSESERKELRNISSRAKISPTKFTNFYNYGGLKADPNEILEKYFDAFYYFSNYSEKSLSFKFPIEALDLSKIQDYIVEDNYSRKTEKYFTFYFDVSSEDSYYSDYEEETESDYLDKLLPIYQEILKGDYRVLYLYWLFSAEKNDYTEELEPPVCPGLKQLTDAQKEFCNFLELDEELLEVASEYSESIDESAVTKKDFQNWISQLSEEEKNKALTELIIQENQFYRYEILQRFERETKKQNKEISLLPARTFEMLINLAEEKQNIRLKKEAEEKKKAQILKETLHKKQRENYLNTLIAKENEIWIKIEELIQKKVPKAYQEAKELLKDLRDLSVMQNQTESFLEKLNVLMNKHIKKISIVEAIKQIKDSL